MCAKVFMKKCTEIYFEMHQKDELRDGEMIGRWKDMWQSKCSKTLMAESMWWEHRCSF